MPQLKTYTFFLAFSPSLLICAFSEASFCQQKEVRKKTINLTSCLKCSLLLFNMYTRHVICAWGLSSRRTGFFQQNTHYSYTFLPLGGVCAQLNRESESFKQLLLKSFRWGREEVENILPLSHLCTKTFASRRKLKPHRHGRLFFFGPKLIYNVFFANIQTS